jgi:Ca2+-binding RTX toxin-like protein
MATISADASITSSIIESTANGLDYIADDIDVVIATNVLVTSRDGFGVNSSRPNSTLINNGKILVGDFTSSHYGVAFVSTGAITNNEGGLIVGTTGVYVDNGAFDIVNHGQIFGMVDSGVLLSTFGGTVLTNDGEIFGNTEGVSVGPATTDGSTIRNSGLIHSNQYGVDVTNAGLTTIIQNFTGGIIRGDTAIHITAGALSLTNQGVIDGGIDCNDFSGTDVVVNRGKIIGEVHLGGDPDVFNSARGSCGAVFGEGGNDRLIGSAGKNTLVGGLDKDTLTGGKGADKFVFNDVLESAVGANRDVITDFSHQQHDKIDLHLIDANTILGGDQAFTFIGKQQFHNTTGELRVAKQGKSIIVSGDLNGDGIADFQIEVHAAGLVKADFIL